MSEEIQKLDKDEKMSLVFNIFNMYKKIKIFETSLKESPKNVLADKVGNLKIFDIAISTLSEEHKRIIENDFMSIERKRRWYEDFYCKSTYYKLRHQAIDAVLESLFI